MEGCFMKTTLLLVLGLLAAMPPTLQAGVTLRPMAFGSGGGIAVNGAAGIALGFTAGQSATGVSSAPESYTETIGFWHWDLPALLGVEPPSPPPLSASVLDGRPLWLETQVGAAILGPRCPIVTVAYATRTAIADSAVHAARAAFSDSASHGPQPWTKSAGNLYRLTGRVGVGTNDPRARLHAKLDGGTLDNYAFFQTSGGTGYAGGILLGNNTLADGTAFKMTSSYNFSGNGRTRFGFINNGATETFVNNGPAMEFDYATGNIILTQYGGRVGIATPSPAYALDVTGDIRASGTIRGAMDADKVDGNHVGLAKVHTLSGTQYILNTSYVQIYAYNVAYAMKITNDGSYGLEYYYSADEAAPVRVWLEPGVSGIIAGLDQRTIDIKIVAGMNYASLSGVCDNSGWITGQVFYQ
jgi:hypothetical protein